jgi:hypothetical protein
MALTAVDFSIPPQATIFTSTEVRGCTKALTFQRVRAFLLSKEIQNLPARSSRPAVVFAVAP